MKRRLGLLAVSAVLATIGFIAPSPASADTDACAGTGTATLNNGFGLPLVTSKTATFTFTFTAGACLPVTAGGKGVPMSGLFATGTVTGACGLSTGSGSTTNGHAFSFLSQGTLLVLTGAAAGAVSAASNPTAGGSCTNTTATNFLITGAVAKRHCVVQQLTVVNLPWGTGSVHVCIP